MKLLNMKQLTKGLVEVISVSFNDVLSRKTDIMRLLLIFKTNINVASYLIPSGIALKPSKHSLVLFLERKYKFTSNTLFKNTFSWSETKMVNFVFCSKL